MHRRVSKISAIGTRGAAFNQVFLAKPDGLGRYVLNRKQSSPGRGNTTNRATSKVYVSTLDEAVELLATDDYLINLVSAGNKRALRQHSRVLVEYHCSD